MCLVQDNILLRGDTTHNYGFLPIMVQTGVPYRILRANHSGTQPVPVCLVQDNILSRAQTFTTRFTM